MSTSARSKTAPDAEPPTTTPELALPPRYTPALLGLLTIGAATIAIAFAWMKGEKPGPNSAEMELFKTLLQIGLVPIAAAAIGLLTAHIQRRFQEAAAERQRQRDAAEAERDRQRAALEYRDSLLAATLNRATSIYTRTKKARRLMRALALRRDSEGESFVIDTHDKLMADLNDAELELEILAREVGATKKAFPEPDRLVRKIRKMDQYLGSVISEYEKMRPTWSGSDVFRKASGSYPTLDDFLGHSAHNKFRGDFVESFHELEVHLLQDIEHSKLAGVPFQKRTRIAGGEEAGAQEAPRRRIGAETSSSADDATAEAAELEDEAEAEAKGTEARKGK